MILKGMEKDGNHTTMNPMEGRRNDMNQFESCPLRREETIKLTTPGLVINLIPLRSFSVHIHSICRTKLKKYT